MSIGETVRFPNISKIVCFDRVRERVKDMHHPQLGAMRRRQLGTGINRGEAGTHHPRLAGGAVAIRKTCYRCYPVNWQNDAGRMIVRVLVLPRCSAFPTLRIFKIRVGLDL